MLRTPRTLVVAAALLLSPCLLIGTASAQTQSLTIESGFTTGLSPQSLPVTMTNTAPVEGFVLAVMMDPALVTIDDVSVVGSVTESVGAELVVPEILTGQGFTLGVVLDAAMPFNAQTIPTGIDQEIANFTARPIVIVPVLTDAIFDFVDGILNNPPLDNVIVEGGLSVGAPQGLGLTSGTLTIDVPLPDTLMIESLSLPSDETGDVRILMSNSSGAVQGFVLAIAHDPADITLEEITLDGTLTETVGAELIVDQILADGGTLGVVLDFQPPFDAQTIPIGTDQHLATYRYSCVAPIIIPAPPLNTALTFVDGVLNSPPLDNVIVVTGLSINPGLVHGTVTCLAVEPPPVENTMFFCGPPNLTGSGPSVIQGAIGDTIDVCFYYKDIDSNIQGLQLAVCYDCNLSFGEFSIDGSILDEVGAEFVNFSVDNDPNDGDGCEFVAGILLDALPPFDGQTAPASFFPLLIGCVDVTIEPTAPCGQDLLIEFCDGVDADGTVELFNIAVIDFESIQDFQMMDCIVEVVPEIVFQRGDCNSDEKVDLADAATILGQQFFGVLIDCADACDANDDGKINLADSVFVLMYLFMAGPPPPDPGPVNAGPDTTPDILPACLSTSSC